MVNELEKRGHTAVAVDIEEMDITDAVSVERVITEAEVEAVIHCAAYTAVDAAEDNVEICRRVNAEGTKNIAKVCKKLDLKMIYISTDYVFDGEGERPWEPDDERHPLNVYGQTKYEGELAVEKYLEKYFIVRIAWVFGVNGKNFIKTMLKLSETHEELNVVDDQVGSPTYTFDLAVSLVTGFTFTSTPACLKISFANSYQVQSPSFVAWYLPYLSLSTISTSDMFPAKAKRPKNSRMSKEKLDANGFHRLPTWQDALERYLSEIR